MSDTAVTDRTEVGFEDENARYHRQNLISWWDQDRLASASVLVVGAGALGNELVKNLALMGVGRVVIADLDRIENSNLARCVFFRETDEGELKAEVLARRAAEVNPGVEFIPVVGDVRVSAGLGLFNDVDLVLGGLDNREARLFVNQACWKTTTPWVDGAIEGLMGVVRVFCPPDTACYECTMSERDHELVAARRTCALLTRDDMLGGKVPTTSTSASIIAAMQVQEAVKLLHRDRLGDPHLAGGGFQYVGTSHESYPVVYGRREDCLSHDTYDLASATVVAPDVTFGELLGLARDALGERAVLDFEHEIVLGAECHSCGSSEQVGEPIENLTAGRGLCPSCGNQWRLQLTHGVEPGDELLSRRPADLKLPPGDVITGRSGMDRVFFLLTGGRPAWELI
ncbi:MAG TPA: ThiF family adenylyltransferase [Solirubrobacteraceae bacterium]